MGIPFRSCRRTRRGKIHHDKGIIRRTLVAHTFLGCEGVRQEMRCLPTGGTTIHQDELPLQHVCALQAFEKWVVEIVGPINPPMHHSHASYIIITTYYIT